MQTVELVQRERMPAGLEDGAAPAFETVAGRALALDLEARPAVGEQQEIGRPGDQAGARPADGFRNLVREAAREAGFDRFGSPDERAVAAVAEQIVPYPVALRELRRAGDIALWIERLDRRDGGRVVEIEAGAGQRLVEEPGAPGNGAGGRTVDEGRHHIRRNGIEHALQNQQIEGFVAKREGQVIGDGVTRPISLVEDAPAVLGPLAAPDMAVCDRAGGADRRFDAEALHERRPAGKPRTLGDELILEHGRSLAIQLHRSKYPHDGRNSCRLDAERRFFIYMMIGRNSITNAEIWNK